MPDTPPHAPSDPLAGIALAVVLGRRLIWFLAGAMLLWKGVADLRLHRPGDSPWSAILFAALGMAIAAYALRSTLTVLIHRPR